MFRRFEVYLLMLLTGASLPAMLFVGGLFVLAQADSLPPPPFSNRISFDEKLRFIRLNGPFDPNVLAVGSSQTLNHFDVGVLRDLFGPSVRALNGSAWGVNVSKLDFLLDFYLSWYSKVGHVITVTSPSDFTRCATEDHAFFDKTDATDYAFRLASDLQYYFVYFAPVSLVKNALKIGRQRTDKHFESSLAFDNFGAVLKSRQLRAHTSQKNYWKDIDQTCFGALRSVAQNLFARNVAFTVVLAPLKPAYVKRVDPDGKNSKYFLDGVTRALKGTGARLFNASDVMQFDDRDFWIATHLYEDTISRLSRKLALLMGPDGRGPRTADNTVINYSPDDPKPETSPN